MRKRPCGLALHPRPGAPGSESRQPQAAASLWGHRCPAKAAPCSPLPSLPSRGQPVGPAGQGNPRCPLGSEAYFPCECTGSVVLEGPQSPPKPVLGQRGKRLVRGASLLLTNCVILGKLVTLSVPQFPHLLRTVSTSKVAWEGYMN